MTGKRKVGNLLALAVLSCLAQQPMHPYELGRTLREHGDDRSIKFNHGSLYMVIGQLARAGFVTEQETSRAGQRPERTVYALTDAGRDELRDWLGELVEQPQHEYPAFVAALSVISALPPSQVLGLLRIRLGHLAEQQAEARGLIDTARADKVPGLFLLEEEYRVALIEAEIAFTDWTGRGPTSTVRTPQPRNQRVEFPGLDHGGSSDASGNLLLVRNCGIRGSHRGAPSRPAAPS
jgi:DNA-binding PadR family transcriptional regulator